MESTTTSTNHSATTKNNNTSRETKKINEYDQEDEIPCGHAVAFIAKRNLNVYDYCASFYKTETLKELYQENVRPLPHKGSVESTPTSTNHSPTTKNNNTSRETKKETNTIKRRKQSNNKMQEMRTTRS